MSTMTKPATLQQRAVQATKDLQQVLGLGDTKILSTALAEVAVEEAQHNTAFVQRIRAAYAELEELKSARKTPSRRSIIEEEPLIPIRTVEGFKYDPRAPLDPYFLQQIYGDHQLRRALDGYSLIRLKEACAIVEAKHPGTRPRNRGRKADIVDYIVEHVAGPGY